MASVLIKNRNLDTDRHTHRKDNVKRHREKTVIYPPRDVGGCQKVEGKHGTDSPSKLGKNHSCQHLDLRILASRTVRPPRLWALIPAASEY